MVVGKVSGGRRAFVSHVALVLTAFAALESARADVVISELMYNSPRGKEADYVELHNTGAAPVDIGGWSLRDGVEFAFPFGTMIPAGGYLIVCDTVGDVLDAYPDLPPGTVYGDWTGSLANEGERIALENDLRELVDEVVWDDKLPWDFLADGFGASLERLCFTADSSSPDNWRAAPVPIGEDVVGGTPAAANSVSMCPPAFPERPPVKISEVMYHAVLEESLVEQYEWVEIHNASDVPIDISGWRLAGGIDFVFPEGSLIDGGAYRVIAKNRALLATVEGYDLQEALIFGDYERELDNGGEKVAILGPEGQGVDLISYDDDAPWPIGADALGAGESWLDSSLLPIEQHRHKGYSLERVSFDIPGTELSNWAPSPLDAPTPGRPNASARAEPLPIVSSMLVAAVDGDEELIRAGQEVRVQAEFSPVSPAGAVTLEFFVEDVARGGEDVVTADMFDDGTSGGDLVPGDGVFTALVPPNTANTVVRYRVVADLGGGERASSPRATDPFPWHSYFVSPVTQTETRVYEVLISSTNWGRMWSNVQGGRVSGCAPSATWNARVPAIFIHEGRVFEAHVRYQGSRWNRSNGRDLNTGSWSGARPSTGPLRALSWRISLPRYNQLGGRSVVTLNKLNQGCPGYNAGVGYRLFGMADVPSPETRFVRLHVNGNYYHYMMEYERPGEEMIDRYNREMAEKYPERPRERTAGHLFKSVGCNCDEGPYGWGDGRQLGPACGHTKEVRYAWTYDRKTHEWDNNAAFVKLNDDLHVARRGGTDALREYFLENFDMDIVLPYMAIMNYSVPFDDMFQNHFFYQRVSDGKWMFTPWDLDRNFGEWQGPNSSIYCGAQGDPSNRSGWWNYFKDAILRAFRDEYNATLLELNNSLLHPDSIQALIDEVTAESNPAEAAQAPSGVACSFPGRASSFASYARTRFAFINNQFGISIDAGPDQRVFAGNPIVLDGSASSPDPAQDTTYSWSIPALGLELEGEIVEATFPKAGEYEAMLAIDTGGVHLTDSLTVTVIPLPSQAFVERDGVVVMEAESFVENLIFDDPPESADAWWEAGNDGAGYSGGGYMEAMHTTRQTFLSRYIDTAPELRFPIRFESPGDYRVWIRARVIDTDHDTLHVALNGEARTSTFAHEFVVDENYLWSGLTRRDEPQVVTVGAAGLQYFSIWIRESGLRVDKIILTQDMDFVPADLGPQESGVEFLGEGNPFVRGDVDRSGKLEITDAVGILNELFRGFDVVECEDHADADDDGRMRISDAIYVLRFLFQRGAPPPAPFPNAGFDRTPDAVACGDGGE